MSARDDETVAVEGPFTVISQNRPLTRQARRALEEFDIRDTIDAGETDEGPTGVSDETTVGVVVSDRPPISLREREEVVIIEEPIEVWTDGDQEVRIFPDRVVGSQDGEMNIAPTEAADFVRDDDRFTPVDVPDDSPLDSGSEPPETAPDAEGDASFDLRSRDTRAVKEVFDAVSRVVDEAILRVGAERISIRAVDAANVASVETELRREEFGLGYQVQPGAVGVDVNEMVSVLREPNKTDKLFLSTDTDAGEIIIESPDADVEERVEMIDPDDMRDEPDIAGTVGSLDYTSAVTVPDDQFRRVVRASGRVSDYMAVGIGVESQGSTFKTLAEGDIDDLLGYPDFEIVGDGVDERTGANFTHTYMDAVSLGFPDPQTDVEMALAGEAKPIRVTFDTTGAIPNQIRYYVAPRIETGSTTGPTTLERLFEADTRDTLIDQPDFEARADGRRAKRLFGYLDGVVDEYRMLVNELGIEVRVVDPSNTILLSADAGAGYFDTYKERDGFPDRVIGVPGSKLADYLSPWTATQEFTLYSNTDRRMLEIEHPIFRVRMSTIDPDSLRQDPDFPTLPLSAEIQTDASALAATANSFFSGVENDDLPTFVAAGGEFLFATRGGNSTSLTAVVDGQGVGVYSPELFLPVLNAIPKTGDATINLGFDMPIVIETDDNGLRTRSTISPRLIQDIEKYEPIVEVLEQRGLDAEFLETGDVEDRFSAFGDDDESISERMKRRRLQNFPIEADVKAKRFGGGDEFTIPESDEMAVEEDTIEAVLDAVEAATENASVGSGDVVGSVTFPAADEFELEIDELEPDAPRRFTTDDGVRFRETGTADDEVFYLSARDETPSRYQIGLRAVPDGFKVGAKPPTEGMDESDERYVQQGMASLVDSVSALVDYAESNTIAGIVEDAGVPADMSTRDAKEELDSLFSRYVDFSVTEHPVSSGEFYLGADGSGALAPDTTFTANISVPQPDIEDPFEVRYSVSFTAKAPAAGEAAQIDTRRELASRTVGFAPTRSDVSRLVEEALDELEGIAPYFARTDRDQPMPAAGLPSPREGDSESIAEHTDAFMPGGGDAIREQARSDGLPVDFSDITGIGPAREETFQDAGVRDIIDYTALVSSIKTVYWVTSLARELPDSPKENLQETAGTIWSRFVWPEREFEGDFDVGNDAPEPDPETQSLGDTGDPNTAPLPDTVDDGRWDVIVKARPDGDFGERFDAVRLRDENRANPDVEVAGGPLEEAESETRSELQAWMFDDGDVVSALSFDDAVRGSVRIAAQTFEPAERVLADRTTDSDGNLTVTADDGWVGIPAKALREASEGDLQTGWTTSPIKDPAPEGLGFGTVVGWDCPGYEPYVYNELIEFPYFVYRLDEDTGTIEGLGIDKEPGERYYVGLHRAPPGDAIIGLVEGSDSGPRPPEPVFESDYADEYDLFPFFRSADAVEETIGETVLTRTSSGVVREGQITREANNGAGVLIEDEVIPDGKFYIPASSRHEDSTFEIIGVPKDDDAEADETEADTESDAADDTVDAVEAIQDRLDVTTSVAEGVERELGRALPSDVNTAIQALTNRVERGDALGVQSLGMMEADELRDGIRRTQMDDDDEEPPGGGDGGGGDTVREVEVKVRRRTSGFDTGTLSNRYRLSLSPGITDNDPQGVAREIRSRVNDMPGTPARFMDLSDPVAVAEVRGGEMVEDRVGTEQIDAPEELASFELLVDENDGAEATPESIADAFPALNSPQAESVAQYVESVEDVLQFTPTALQEIDGIADRTVGDLVGGDVGFRSTQTLEQQGVEIESDTGPEAETVSETIDAINSALSDTSEILDRARDAGVMGRGRVGRLRLTVNRLEQLLDEVESDPKEADINEAESVIEQMRERQEAVEELIAEEEEADEPEEPEQTAVDDSGDDSELSQGEIETIVENATAGVTAAAVIIEGTLQRIRMGVEGNVPIEAEQQITAQSAGTREETVLRAIERWETFTDLSAVSRSDINERREALNESFGLNIPLLDSGEAQTEESQSEEAEESDEPASRTSEIDRRIRERVTAVMEEANFPVTDPPATFDRSGGLFIARPDVGSEWRQLLETTPGVLQSEQGQSAREFALDYVNAIFDMSTEQVQSQVDTEIIDGSTETERDDTGSVPDTTERMFRTDLEQPFSEVLDIALRQDIPKEEREQEMATVLEESGLFVEEVPGKFTDATVGLDFPRGGVGGGRDFAENVRIEVGGVLGDEPKSRMSVPGFLFMLSVKRPLINLDDAWSEFVELVQIADVEMDGFPEVSEKLDSVTSTTAFQIEENRINWSEAFVDPNEIAEVASRSGEYWSAILEDMKQTSSAWWAAQRVREVAVSGNQQIRSLLEEELQSDPPRGTAAWYLQNAYEIFLDFGDFDAVQYVQDWHRVFDPGESKSDARRRRGEVDLDRLRRRAGDAPEEVPEEPPEPVTEEPTETDVGSEFEPVSETGQSTQSDEPKSKTVDDLKSDILDRM
jgi:hypothetical protein